MGYLEYGVIRRGLEGLNTVKLVAFATNGDYSWLH